MLSVVFLNSCSLSCFRDISATFEKWKIVETKTADDNDIVTCFDILRFMARTQVKMVENETALLRCQLVVVLLVLRVFFG